MGNQPALPEFYTRNILYVLTVVAACWGILLLFQHSTVVFAQDNTPPDAQNTKQMTLSDCVFLAVRHNRSIKSAYLDRVVQKFNLVVAEDQFVPNVTVTPFVGHTSKGDGDERYYTNKNSISAEIKEEIPTGAEFTFTWTDTAERKRNSDPDEDSFDSSWNISLKQPLLKGAGIKVNTAVLKSARIEEKKNILALRATISDTITSAITAYRSFVQAGKSLEINRASVARAKELLAVNRALIAAGRMAQVEIVQTKADLASKELSLTQAENALDAARLSLIKVLDIDRNTKITPTAKIDIEPVRPDPGTCSALALQNRPDYLQSVHNLEIAELDLIVAKNNRLWDLSLVGSYGIEGTDELSRDDAFKKSQNSDRSAWDIGLSLTIPLYGDLTRQQNYLAKKAAFEKTEIAHQELQENVEIEVLDGIRDVEMKLRQVELARQSRELSEQKLEIEKVKLKAGRSSNFQLVTFQNDLIAAQNSELEAAIAYLNALTTLDKILGTTVETWKIEIKK